MKKVTVLLYDHLGKSLIPFSAHTVYGCDHFLFSDWSKWVEQHLDQGTHSLCLNLFKDHSMNYTVYDIDTVESDEVVLIIDHLRLYQSNKTINSFFCDHSDVEQVSFHQRLQETILSNWNRLSYQKIYSAGFENEQLYRLFKKSGISFQQFLFELDISVNRAFRVLHSSPWLKQARCSFYNLQLTVKINVSQLSFYRYQTKSEFARYQAVISAMQSFQK